MTPGYGTGTTLPAVGKSTYAPDPKPTKAPKKGKKK